MAMNKKEQAQYNQALVETAEALIYAERNRALRWSNYPEKPDLPPPASSFGARAFGWSFNTHNRKVTATWSECVSHGNGHSLPQQYESGTQQSICQFSTKKRAYMALRRALEVEYANYLFDIDKEIAGLKDD